ncbi:MAG TPA: helix-turn-helix transcriptional regulator [Sporosarcina psychrophila]|uniref:Helix-turn-helix transcriptional regulator n=1 Tax=Sporosarcina psychrophila TaxID=1476 RepID=A0A921G009_SPOPS|nr:helix-turn-helix transcriptional regulator [Sporosarcina psychrophila]
MSKDELYLLRRKKGVRLREIADYIGCSIAMVSLYETDKANFEKNKAIQYSEFIQSY